MRNENLFDRNGRDKHSNADAAPSAASTTPTTVVPANSVPTTPKTTSIVPTWVNYSPYIGAGIGLGVGFLRKSGIIGYAFYGGLGYIAFQAVKMYYASKYNATTTKTDIDSQISDLFNAMASKNPNISASDIANAKTWVSANLNSNEKNMLVDFYSATTNSSISTDATSLLAAGASAIGKYGLTATTAFMGKIPTLNTILKQSTTT